jgi:hypothetical protein
MNMAETAARAAVKPGWQTTEFYTTVGGMIAPYLVESLPATWKVVLSTAAGVVYTIARLLTKFGIRR